MSGCGFSGEGGSRGGAEKQARFGEATFAGCSGVVRCACLCLVRRREVRIHAHEVSVAPAGRGPILVAAFFHVIVFVIGGGTVVPPSENSIHRCPGRPVGDIGQRGKPMGYLEGRSGPSRRTVIGI